MHGEYIGTAFLEIGDIPARIHYHEVHVKRFLGVFLNILYHWLTE